MLRRLTIIAILASGILAPAVGCAALEVLVNQAGYEANAPKIVRVQRASDYAGDGTFSVRKSSDNSTVFSGTLARKGPLWDKFYWQGDFSSLRTGGDYYIYVDVNGETGSSFNFAIGVDALLNKTGKLVYQYFQAQRCGTAVSFEYEGRNGAPTTFSHNACHLDDGYINPSGPQLDCTGGWHDAGDYGKYGHGFAGNPVSDLLVLYESNTGYYDAIDVNSNGLADIVDEALWQARWLVKIVDANGHVMESMGQRRTGASWVKPENDTNNNPGTSDDRWIYPGNENTPQETVVCAALIKMHRLLAAKGLPTENFAQKALAIWNHRVALAISEGGHNNLGCCAQHIWAGLDLYAVFGQQDCWDRALQRVDEAANNVINNPAAYDDNAESPGYELGVLAWFVRNYPNTSKTQLARTAVQSLMNHDLYLADNPIGLIRRLESGQLQYFPANPSLGINRLYGFVTWGAIEAYKTIGDPAYLKFALDQYNWILGANYNKVCLMEAAGDYHLNKYHSRYDTIIPNAIEPGVVTNGYIRSSTGLPWTDFGTGSVSVQTNESWLPNSSAYALALAGMTVFRNSSQMVSNTIPSSIYVSQTVPVTVTVKNTGYIPWTQTSEFKLGAVGDTDPFAGNRMNLSGGDSIGNEQQKVFTFNLTAPATTGTYTTDWRMVQEGVGWFGDTLTRQVQVLPNTPPPPVTGFSATAGDQQVSLSWTNPNNVNYAGTMIRFKTTGYPTSPTDGALVVDRLAAAGSTDTWVHTGLTNGQTHYYRAFSRNSVANCNTSTSVTASVVPAYDALWMNQIFDPFANGNLGGQGNWTTPAFESQVQSAMANTGKALLLDSVAAAGTISNSFAGFSKKTSGTPTVSFDVAQIYSGASTTAFGSVSFYADDDTEIARFACIANSWRLEYGSGSISVLSATVTQNTWYNIKITFDLAQRKIGAYVNGASRASNLAFKAGSGSNIARIGVSTSLVTGLTAQKMYLDNLRGETAPVLPAAVMDDGAYTGSLSKLHCSWTSGGQSSVEHRYAIGTSIGGTNIVGWTTVGSADEVTKEGLSLAAGATYYFAVQGGNGYGAWTSSVNSNGIKTPSAAVSIQAAKALANGSAAADNKAIRGKVISAAFPGYFYIQEPGSYYGLKAVSSAAVTPGASVDLAGLMKGAGAERYLDCTGNAVTVTTPGPSGPDPITMMCASAGGVQLNSYTPGVAGARGPNNIGLLVRVCGRLVSRDVPGGSFVIDDGSGPIKVYGVIVQPTGQPYVVVTGVVVRDDAGTAAIRPWRQTDIVEIP